MDRRIRLLRRLAASTTFEGERKAALAKIAELEARSGASGPSRKSRSVAPPSPFGHVVSDTIWTPNGRQPTASYVVTWTTDI